MLVLLPVTSLYNNSQLELVPYVSTEEDPCECDSLVKFQKKVEDALQALTKKYILDFRWDDVRIWRLLGGF